MTKKDTDLSLVEPEIRRFRAWVETAPVLAVVIATIVVNCITVGAQYIPPLSNARIGWSIRWQRHSLTRLAGARAGTVRLVRIRNAHKVYPAVRSALAAGRESR
jgi:hypothetical protein